MIDAVKSITVNPVRKPLIGSGINRCCQRHLAMESGIENRNLRYWPEQFLDDFHPFQFGTIVKWSKGGNPGDGRFHFRRDQYGIFIVRATVNDAVSHNINSGRCGNGPSVTLPKIGEQLLNGLGARSYFCALFPDTPLHILERNFSDLAIPLDLALPLARNWVIRNGFANLIETALLAARTRIEDKNLHQYGQVQFWISGISSPCSWMYCLWSTSLSRRNSFKCAPTRCSRGTRSTTSPAK